MMINVENLSVAQLVELKQTCENLLNKRHIEEIKKTLNKLLSVLDELNDLDPSASVFDGYDWEDLKNEIKNNYTY